ncbi:MAG: homoserine dehydrogenase [Flavobacteriales bacterium]|jgi:homoserine dehydrogenase
MSTTLNIAIFGIGNVGSTLLKQITSFNDRSDTNTNGIKINVFAIANSSLILFSDIAVSDTWNADFEADSDPYTLEDVFAFKNKLITKTILDAKSSGSAASEVQYIAVDVTASPLFVNNYLSLIENGFHIVTANKIANTLSYEFYLELREALDLHKKQFHYETNVGAGLPIIETIKNLHQSGEEIRKIRGVFSGSLSYLFNTFSKEEKDFSEILLEADALGLTEPDAREDLSGKDVARKLLILGREVGLIQEFEDVKVQSLVPAELNGETTLPQFRESIKKLDAIFAKNKDALGSDEVLRHVGELDMVTGQLEVKLIQEPSSTALGQIKGADAVFEIYTDSYGDQPLVIQGAGAGKAVTARGVLGDILKVARSNH